MASGPALVPVLCVIRPHWARKSLTKPGVCVSSSKESSGRAAETRDFCFSGALTTDIPDPRESRWLGF